MSEQVTTHHAGSVEVLSLCPEDRKEIFDKVYSGNPSLDLANNLFNKSTREFDDKEKKIYSRYYGALGAEELILLQNAVTDFKRAKIESEQYRTNFYNLFDKKVDEILLVLIANELGELLNDIVDNNLDDRKRDQIVKIISECCEFDRKSLGILLKILKLTNIYDQKARIPVDSQRKPYAPSAMNAKIQNDAARNHLNFVFPYPFEVLNHFPVFFCHSVFVDFMDILNGNDKNGVVGEFKNYLNTESNIKMKLDACISQLIESILSYKEGEKEKDLVEKVVAAIKILFSPSQVKENLEITTGIANLSSKIEMDAAITINGFPFVLFVAKNSSYSINAVLQALQYYGLSNTEFIDNEPCFLITFDRGILYVYGAAKVNRRIVCSCLLSLEFTNYFYNIRKFTDTLFKCLGSLVFFFDKFAARIENKANDPLHIKYFSIKSAPSYDNQPLPAIFSIKNIVESEERIKISFEGSIEQTFFKPGVYRVRTNDGFAVLKLASNYDVNTHKKLSDENLAPRLLGHETLCDNFEIILMELLDESVYDSIFNFFYNRIDLAEEEIDKQALHKSLHEILSELQRLNIVHGDFRSNNIIAKRSIADPKILEDFKLVDFEYSGKVDDPYPCLATKNPGIIWPTSFNSYEPRKFEHDEFMLQQMIETHFMGRTRN